MTSRLRGPGIGIRTRLVDSVRRSDGQSLVEFALASMLLFTVIFGTIEFARATWQYNMVSALAQEGARWAAVRGSGSSSPANAAAVQSYVQSRAPFSVTVTTTPAPSSISAGSTVTVHVQTAFSSVTRLVPVSTLALDSTAKMIMWR
jgi:Flp pilus assembly protein TadG